MTCLSLFLLLGGCAAAAPSSVFPVKLETRGTVTSRLSNVHLSVEGAVEGPVTVTYGPCASLSARDAHHTLGETPATKGSNSTRLVWVLPERTESGACLSAWDSAGALVGRSEPQLLQNRHVRRAMKRAGACRSADILWGQKHLLRTVA